jgi:translation elongation factor EF-1beta
MDLSDDEGDDAANALIARKVAEKEAQKKAAKATQDTTKMAKSTLVLDVKPEDSETDLGLLDKLIKAIKIDGLVWGPTERVPVAFGIQKLRIGTVVVDDLVSIDELQEQIEEIEGVQSTDIAAFNKI